MIELYTDGACSGNPGPGGWAFAVVKEGNITTSRSEYLPATTNNICELLSIINGIYLILYHFPHENEIVVYSDSAYAVNGYNDWINNWVRNGWQTAKKEPVKNQELWENLWGYKQLEGKNITIKKVKGHGGNKFNNFVDRLAVDAYKNRN